VSGAFLLAGDLLSLAMSQVSNARNTLINLIALKTRTNLLTLISIITPRFLVSGDEPMN
jgi:hypothetical protein